MKRFALHIVTLLIATAAAAASSGETPQPLPTAAIPELGDTLSPRTDAPREIVDTIIVRRKIVEPDLEQVVIDGDTVSVLLDQFNFGRYDRGLHNYLFIPKGQWAFGITASYGEFDADDVQILSMLKDFDFNGKTYSLSPSVSYFFRNNQSIGLRFSYNRSIADIGSLAIDIDDDMNFSIHDVSYYSNSYNLSLFYRNYVGLSRMKRFGIFNEVELAFSSGASRFNRLYNDTPRDTRTVSTGAALNFSPGLCMYIMDYVSFNVSFGVFGFHLTKEKQTTDNVEEGSRFSSGANFKFNLFNIKFGLSVNI